MSSRKLAGSKRATGRKADLSPCRDDELPGRVYWWFFALLFLIGGNSDWILARVRVVDWRDDALLAPATAWSTPLAHWGTVDRLAQWPFPVFACVAACLLAQFAGRLSRSAPLPLVMCFTAGAALSFLPEVLLPAAAIYVLAAVLPESDTGRPSTSTVLKAGASGVLVAFLTHEFGLILLFAGLLLASRSHTDHRSPALARMVPYAVILLVAAAAAICQFVGVGFAATLLRPVNWLAVSADPELMPALSSSIERELGRMPMLLMSTVPVWAWLTAAKSGHRGGVSRALLVVFTSIGLGCAHFLWLCLFAIGGSMQERRQAGRWSRGLVVIGISCAVLSVAGRYDLYRQYLSGGVSTRHRIDLSQWDVSGPVLLTDLSHSKDWQEATIRNRLPLLIDDRWEACGRFYTDYAAFCRDTTEVRMESYLRADGSWGGYTRWLREWEPALLVCDSSSVAELRNLSLSPHWKLVGIDGRRTVFGRAGHENLKPVIRRASHVLSDLEFGMATQTPSTSVVAQPVRPVDRRNVAGALNALRLPYASLKMLDSSDNSPAADGLRSDCYIDLAHRVRRHTGEYSLLDQFRAAYRSRGHTSTASGGVTRKPGGGQNASERPPADFFTDAYDPVEARVRSALFRGDVAEVLELTESLAPAARNWYGALAASHDVAPVDLLVSLVECIHDPAFPVRLRAEAWFYAGCLATEVGDRAIAAESFHHCRNADRRGVYEPLCQFYLIQLGR